MNIPMRSTPSARFARRGVAPTMLDKDVVSDNAMSPFGTEPLSRASAASGDRELAIHTGDVVAHEVADELVSTGCQRNRYSARGTGLDALARA